MKILTLSLAGLLTATSVSHADLTISPTRSAWTTAVENTTTEPILTQSFDGTEAGDTTIPVATETFNIFGNFSVYYENSGNISKRSYDYRFNTSTDSPLDLGIDITGTDTTTVLEFRFASPQIGFAADFSSVDLGEGLTLTLFNGTTPTGETVNFDTILPEEDGGDGFVGFTTDFPFTSFAFGPIIFGDDAVSNNFHLDEISTVAAVTEPVITVPPIVSSSLSDGTFTFIVHSSILGHRYQIQSNPRLALDQWIDTGDTVTGTGEALAFEIVVPPTETMQFYRVTVTAP